MKRGDVVEFNERIPRFSGTKCLIVPVSRHTGGLTVMLLSSAGEAYPAGTELNVSAYELRSSMEAR